MGPESHVKLNDGGGLEESYQGVSAIVLFRSVLSCTCPVPSCVTGQELPSPYTLPYDQVSFHDLSIGFFPAKGETGISGLIA